MIVSAELGFELLERIGASEGRNSEVYRAFDPQLEAEVAVKRVRKAAFEDVALYYGEARKLYDARHPNVVDVRVACQDEEYIYLAMPIYDGGSLHSIGRAARLPNRDVIHFGLDMLQGLHHVHSRRLVHFDVKPSNVLVDVSGKAALSDFGLAKHLRPDGLAQVDQLYFLHWPPEYMIAQDLSQAADIYQAGLTLYRLLVGVESLERQSAGRSETEVRAAIQSGTFPDRSVFPLHVPGSLRRVVRTALLVDPGERYATVLDMIASLAAVNQQLDWLYTTTRDQSDQVWEMETGGQLRRVHLRKSGKKWNLTSTKTNVSTSTTRRQNRLSGDEMTWGEARGRTIKALRELG